MPRSQKRYHYIYKITRDDGRYYIGMHSTDDLDDGYFGSGKRITRSIKKHGKDRHRKEILEHLPSREALKFREKELISDELRADPMCMNIAPGGGGGFISEQHMSKTQRAGTMARAKQIRENGQHENTLKALINSAKGRNCNWTGRSHRNETKVKIGNANAISQLGERNSQYGTCWVNLHQVAQKIPRSQLQEYLSKGFRVGRK